MIGLILGVAAAACTLGREGIERRDKEKKMKEEVSNEVTEQTSDIRNSMSLLDARVSVLEEQVEDNTRNIDELKARFNIT